MLSKMNRSVRPLAKLLTMAPVRFDTHWPRPDPTPPKVIAVARLVPPFMRALYFKHAYYPEYKARTDDALIEDLTGATLQFYLFHLFFVGVFLFYYFAFQHWLPEALKVVSSFIN